MRRTSVGFCCLSDWGAVLIVTGDGNDRLFLDLFSEAS